jgi:hypothetical protein
MLSKKYYEVIYLKQLIKIILPVIIFSLCMVNESMARHSSKIKQELFDKAIAAEKSGNYKEALKYWKECVKKYRSELTRDEIKDVKDKIVINKYELKVKSFLKSEEGSVVDIHNYLHRLIKIYSRRRENNKVNEKNNLIKKLEINYPELKEYEKKHLNRNKKNTIREVNKSEQYVDNLIDEKIPEDKYLSFQEPNNISPKKGSLKRKFRHNYGDTIKDISKIKKGKHSKILSLNKKVVFLNEKDEPIKELIPKHKLVSKIARNGGYVGVKNFKEKLNGRKEANNDLIVYGDKGERMWEIKDFHGDYQISDDAEYVVTTESLIEGRMPSKLYLYTKDGTLYRTLDFSSWEIETYEVFNNSDNIIILLRGISDDKLIVINRNGDEIWSKIYPSQRIMKYIVSSDGRYICMSSIKKQRNVVLSILDEYGNALFEDHIRGISQMKFSNNSKYLVTIGINKIILFSLESDISILWQQKLPLYKNDILISPFVYISNNSEYIFVSGVTGKRHYKKGKRKDNDIELFVRGFNINGDTIFSLNDKDYFKNEEMISFGKYDIEYIASEKIIRLQTPNDVLYYEVILK